MEARQRLVLVDEDEQVREYVTASLVAQGYNCVGVRDLSRASAVSERLQVSGVLVNVGSLTEGLIAEMVRFRHQHPGLPLVAFDPPETKQEGTSGPRPAVRRHLRLVAADGLTLDQPERTPTYH